MVLYHFALMILICWIHEWFDWKLRPKNFTDSNWGIGYRERELGGALFVCGGGRRWPFAFWRGIFGNRIGRTSWAIGLLFIVVVFGLSWSFKFWDGYEGRNGHILLNVPLWYLKKKACTNVELSCTFLHQLFQMGVLEKWGQISLRHDIAWNQLIAGL